MKKFYGDDLLLDSPYAETIYAQVKDLPIIDYHCHLDQRKIAENAEFSDIGELWLSGDHYKWRAMRLCGVEERYLTGNASYHDKFIKYAQIVPLLAGNPLYYWTHMELKQIFGINEPLCSESAERIYNAANKTLRSLRVRDLLKKYKVEYVATTDDPCDDLSAHGNYGGTAVAPTFRPDKAYNPIEYTAKLEKAVGRSITTAAEYLNALIERLDYFVSKGCKITDHGFERFPSEYADDDTAEKLFGRRDTWMQKEQEKFFGWLLCKLTREYGKRGLIMQIHFAVVRNNNGEMFGKRGADCGFDLIGEPQSVKDIIEFFNRVSDGERPLTVLYTLNDSNLSAIAAVTGAFRNVRMGAAWWFNDTVEGIRRNLETIAEYSCLGTNFGMLTDSRSFSSYARFDFFRRILADYLGKLADSGEYPIESAIQTAKDICYYNIKGALGL